MLRPKGRALLVSVVALLAGCERAPRPLVAGTDACDYCRMTVSDVRFGAELQSRTGKIHAFDAVECLASFYIDATARNDVRGTWVTDFESGRMLPADSAVYLEGGSLKSPMGRSIVAFSPEGSDAASGRYGGRVLSWSKVLDLVRGASVEPGSHGHLPADSTAARDTGGRG